MERTKNNFLKNNKKTQGDGKMIAIRKDDSFLLSFLGFFVLLLLHTYIFLTTMYKRKRESKSKNNNKPTSSSNNSNNNTHTHTKKNPLFILKKDNLWYIYIMIYSPSYALTSSLPPILDFFPIYFMSQFFSHISSCVILNMFVILH